MRVKIALLALLAVGAAHRVPGVGGAGEVAQDALALDVLVEPAPQARPGPGERLVGELDDAVVAGDQPGADQQLDEAARGRRRSPPGGAGSRLRTGCPRGSGATSRSSRSRSSGRWSAGTCVVELLGRLGDGAPDAAGGAVAVDGERPPLAALPGGAQGVGQQRQGARLALDLPHQQVDQPRFEQQPGLVRRPLDGRPQIGSRSMAPSR